jgi:hypothetical protein
VLPSRHDGEFTLSKHRIFGGSFRPFLAESIDDQPRTTISWRQPLLLRFRARALPLRVCPRAIPENSDFPGKRRELRRALTSLG